jgi:polysaccharide biosynthesis protein PslG
VISGEPLPDAAELDRMGRGKVGTLRINLAWGTVQTSPGALYDWSHYDSVIGEAAKNGIRVLPTVYSSPVWAEPSPEYPPLGDRLPEFEDFARAAVQRYGSDGTFWKENPGIPKLPLTLWQLWNEPNSPLFWKPAPNVGDFLGLLRGFDSTLERADPKAQVMLGGLFPTPRGGISMEDFMAGLYRGGAKAHFDATAIHPYAATPANALASVADLRNVMDAAGDRDTPIWITEVGWASGGDPSGLTVGPAQQAAYLTRTLELAAQQRERLGIDGVIWYSLNDAPGSVWPAHCGLFSLDGRPKPSWDAFVALTGGTS